MIRYLSIFLLFLSCISINQQDIENDIINVIVTLDQYRSKEVPGKPLIYVCDEILPIDDKIIPGIKISYFRKRFVS